MKFTKSEIKEAMLLYAVTDRMWLKDDERLADVVEKVLEGGATFMQVREKELAAADFEEEAAEIKELCIRFGVPFVVNDDIDIAMKIKADGVHVGQSDIKGRDIRAIIGDDMILGISVGTVAEACEAEKAGADYIGVGAMFATGTKKDARMITNETLKAITEAVSIPVVAIGGISADNIEQLRGTGIDGIAVVSAIFAAEDPKKATSELRASARAAFNKANTTESSDCTLRLGEMLENVRKKSPLIHNITNYVTVNDCANIVLACGASPIMADDAEEAEAITAICSGLNINIGTLNRQTIPAMFKAGKKANELGHPVVLDPVGAGASSLRTDTACKLLEEIDFTVIKGNISEIKTLACGSGGARGVDADAADAVTDGALQEATELAKAFAARTGAIIAVTGAIDIVADAERACVIYNGHPMMSSITGTGCQLSAMLTAFEAANPENKFEAAVSAVCAMGVAGEIAQERLTVCDGNASYRNFIIDAIYRLDADTLQARAKVRIM